MVRYCLGTETLYRSTLSTSGATSFLTSFSGTVSDGTGVELLQKDLIDNSVSIRTYFPLLQYSQRFSTSFKSFIFTDTCLEAFIVWPFYAATELNLPSEWYTIQSCDIKIGKHDTGFVCTKQVSLYCSVLCTSKCILHFSPLFFFGM